MHRRLLSQVFWPGSSQPNPYSRSIFFPSSFSFVFVVFVFIFLFVKILLFFFPLCLFCFVQNLHTVNSLLITIISWIEFFSAYLYIVSINSVVCIMCVYKTLSEFENYMRRGLYYGFFFVNFMKKDFGYRFMFIK